MFYIDEDRSFELKAYVEVPGEMSIVPRGYLVSRRPDGVYMAPLIPALFYGADGNPLDHSWRQNIASAGEQTVLSRFAGSPKVPREELYWRKVQSTQTSTAPSVSKDTSKSVKPLETSLHVQLLIGTIGSIIGGFILYKLLKKT